jgi:bromodomain-containing factor 1
MDLSTVAKKLQTGAYQRAKDFESDVRLIFSNCYKFNPEGNPVHEMGKQLEAVFEEKWAQKHLWIADNAPTAQSPSQSGSDEEESDDGEETEQAAQSSAATAALAQRLIEEQTKLITLMQAKNPDQGLIQMQQDMVALVQSRIQENAKSTAPGKKAPKKPKAPKGAKKPAPKKAAGGPGKKGAASRQRYLGTLEKETISAGLASLPDEVAESVLEMIKNDKPDVDVSLAPADTLLMLTPYRLLRMEPWSWTLT